MGNLANQKVPEEERLRIVEKFPLTFLEAFQSSPYYDESKSGKFKMAFIGGMITVFDEKAKLWWGDSLRKRGVSFTPLRLCMWI